MIRINLLPHREERRKQRQKDFVALMLLSGIFGALIVIAVGAYFSSQLSEQQAVSYTHLTLPTICSV